MKRKSSIFGIAGLITMLLLAACGGSGTTGNSSPTATSTKTSNTITANATLKHVPSGTADLSWDLVSRALTVKVMLSGLAPNSIHPAHIHKGSCSNQGAVLYPLQNIVADAAGNGSSTTKIMNVTTGILGTGWYINVHNGPGLTPADQFLPIVCGDITNSHPSITASQSLRVTLDAAPGASMDQAAMGTAQLSLTGSTLTVKLTLSGLAPNSAHAAHIHSGSCTNQGSVVYPLQNVTADASGKATVTTTIHNVKSIPASGWYVNVHHSTQLTNQTGFDPIACGNVTLG